MNIGMKKKKTEIEASPRFVNNNRRHARRSKSVYTPAANFHPSTLHDGAAVAAHRSVYVWKRSRLPCSNARYNDLITRWRPYNCA